MPVVVTDITGAELAEEIEALIRRVPGLARRRIGPLVYGTPSGINKLRQKGRVTQVVVDRVRALIANPPPEAFSPPPKARKQKPERLSTAERGWRIAAGMKKANRIKAEARIAAGLDARNAGAALRITQRAIERTMEQRARAHDPIEQAKTLIRRSGRVVYSMSVHGGPSDKFIISGRGSEPIDTEELLQLAQGLAA